MRKAKQGGGHSWRLATAWSQQGAQEHELYYSLAPPWGLGVGPRPTRNNLQVKKGSIWLNTILWGVVAWAADPPSNCGISSLLPKWVFQGTNSIHCSSELYSFVSRIANTSLKFFSNSFCSLCFIRTKLLHWKKKDKNVNHYQFLDTLQLRMIRTFAVNT